MKMEKQIHIDSIDAYNKLYGFETLHPLVSVVKHNSFPNNLSSVVFNYDVYALFLKQGEGCTIRYGREKYDYQAGTIVSFKPGARIEVVQNPNMPIPKSRGILFHPDIIYGTQLGRRISEYSFFDYDQREALHLSEREQITIEGIFDTIEDELQHPIDKHSQQLITDSIELLLDYCMRFYDRQFITRHKVNSTILSDFDRNLTDYLISGKAEQIGIPMVNYFAEKACLSAGYFGDLIKKETGKTAQQYIQLRIIGQAKQWLLESQRSVNQVAVQLGFQYPQHFTRMFKKVTGMSPSEYRAN